MAITLNYSLRFPYDYGDVKISVILASLYDTTEVNTMLMLAFCNDVLLGKILDFLTLHEVAQLAKVSKAVNLHVKYYICVRRKFNFSGCKKAPPLLKGTETWSVVLKNENIRELDFTNCGKWLYDVLLYALLVRNRQLKKLCLRNCHSDRLSDASIIAIAENCKALEYLNLDDCNWFTPDAFSLLGKSSKQLRTLSLNSCSSIDETSLAVVLKNTVHLRELRLRYCWQLGDKILETIGQNCKDLRVLDFSRCSKVSDVIALKVASGCTQIEDINLTKTPMSNWSLRLLGSVYGNNLRSVSLAATDADDVVMGNIAINNNSRLRYIDLSYCHKVRDGTLRSLSEHCPMLRSLNLTGCHGVSNDALEAIGGKFRLLTELILEDCYWVKSDSFLKIAAKFRHLKTVNLKGCCDVDDKPLIALFKKNNALESINISGCYKVTTSAIRSLACCCKAITVLSIADCLAIDDVGLRHLALCSEIAFLDMEGCSVLSAGTLAKIGINCKKLQRLSIPGCKRINIRSLITVVANNQRLKYIDISECFQRPKDVCNLVKTFNARTFVDC